MLHPQQPDPTRGIDNGRSETACNQQTSAIQMLLPDAPLLPARMGTSRPHLLPCLGSTNPALPKPGAWPWQILTPHVIVGLPSDLPCRSVPGSMTRSRPASGFLWGPFLPSQVRGRGIHFSDLDFRRSRHWAVRWLHLVVVVAAASNKKQIGGLLPVGLSSDCRWTG